MSLVREQHPEERWGCLRDWSKPAATQKVVSQTLLIHQVSSRGADEGTPCRFPSLQTLLGLLPVSPSLSSLTNAFWRNEKGAGNHWGGAWLSLERSKPHPLHSALPWLSKVEWWRVGPKNETKEERDLRSWTGLLRRE